MSLVLHVGNRRYSSWSLRASLALAHSGLAYDERVVWLDQPDTRANLAALSPGGRVPVLQDGDLVVWESLAICEYIAELAPAAGLWPADRARRAHARAIANEMHAGFAALRRDMSMDMCGKRPGVGHTPEALADARRIQAIWRDALAASGGPFLYGTFTIADAMYAPVTTRFTTYGVDLDAICRGYVDAVAALPAMQRCRAEAEGEPELPDHR